MKSKIFALLTAAVMLVSFIPAFAAEDAAEDAVMEDNISLSDDAFIDPAVEEVLQVEDEDTIKDELDTLAQDILKETVITKDNILALLKNTNAYLLKRQVYFKRTLGVIKKIESVKDEVTKKGALLEFGKKYSTDKELDKKVYIVIEKEIKFIKENAKTLTQIQKVNKLLKSLVKLYFNQRKVNIHITNKIVSLNDVSLKDEIKETISLATSYSENGRYLEAKQALEKLLDKGVRNTDVFKSASAVLKKIDGEGPKVFVKGKIPTFDVQPKIINGRTMVPLKQIANALGVLDTGIKWDGTTKTITLIKGDKTVELVVGVPSIKINGVSITIDVPATIDNGRTLVPASTVAKALDAKVSYDAASQAVTIEDSFGSEESGTQPADLGALGVGSADELTTKGTNESVADEVSKVDETKIDATIQALE